jgi:hypothetical protein
LQPSAPVDPEPCLAQLDIAEDVRYGPQSLEKLCRFHDNSRIEIIEIQIGTYLGEDDNIRCMISTNAHRN